MFAGEELLRESSSSMAIRQAGARIMNSNTAEETSGPPASPTTAASVAPAANTVELDMPELVCRSDRLRRRIPSAAQSRSPGPSSSSHRGARIDTSRVAVTSCEDSEDAEEQQEDSPSDAPLRCQGRSS